MSWGVKTTRFETPRVSIRGAGVPVRNHPTKIHVQDYIPKNNAHISGQITQLVTHLFVRSLTLSTRAIWSPHYLKTPQQKAAMIQQLTLKISFASLLQGQNSWYAQVKSNRPLSRKIILLIEGGWHWGGVQLDCHESWWNGISPTWTSLTSGEFSFNSLPAPFLREEELWISSTNGSFLNNPDFFCRSWVSQT